MIFRCVRRSLLVLVAAGLSPMPAWGQVDNLRKVGADPQSGFTLAIRQINGTRVGIAQFKGLVMTCQEFEESSDLEGEIGTESDAPLRKLVVAINRGSFEELLFGQNSSAATVRSRFELRLKQKLDAVEHSGTLSDSQKEKLRLAGRGDMKHFFDRATRIEAKFGKFDDIHDFDQFEKWMTALSDEAQAFQDGFGAEPFDGNSLFAKTLKTTLTAEHAAAYARAPAWPLADAARVASPESLALAANKCWDVLGLRLEKADPPSLAAFRNRYRGGMRVVEVRTNGVAEKHGVRNGDIIVGLGAWETVRGQDISYILNQQNFGSEPLKFYMVRGQEVLTGTLRFPR